MTVKQISVFVENKPGQLAEFTKLLRQHNIDMRALSIAETPDFGILRVIVDDSYKTACILKDAEYIFSITPVLAVPIEDEAGGLDKILTILAENGINLEYTYAFITRNKDLAYMIFRVTDNEKAMEVLSQHGIKTICQDQLSSL
ncbi:ACT domain-containing protein [Massiliimalia timonensis]|uniref:ACT domain-containing protein n=1 Tax=Massiliimalia timonensis TaxID=1987501 RepID=A0A8J6PEU7_9FIRM|nr:ACT domain-containing protein [Massiliimalia timonensis]MBC8610487.1 ACT domain-containing protein [Massiliimalia timonensis]MBS7175094.1 ACT domain-containing protein [Clostridiales bacterium]